MKKSSITQAAGYFDQYLQWVPDDLDLVPALQKSILDMYQLNKEHLRALGDTTYAPDKWTVRQILLHVADTERIFSYRALCFARRSSNTPLGFDEKAFAEQSGADQRSVESILDELVNIRQSTLAFFKNLTDEQLLITGINWKFEMSVLAMGFLIIGHQTHHFKIIENLYFPLLSQ